MKSKIIIENRTSLSDAEALRRVEQVVREGRISNNGKSYCYCSRFGDDVFVSAFTNKNSDRFVVHYND